MLHDLMVVICCTQRAAEVKEEWGYRKTMSKIYSFTTDDDVMMIKAKSNHFCYPIVILSFQIRSNGVRIVKNLSSPARCMGSSFGWGARSKI